MYLPKLLILSTLLIINSNGHGSTSLTLHSSNSSFGYSDPGDGPSKDPVIDLDQVADFAETLSFTSRKAREFVMSSLDGRVHRATHSKAIRLTRQLQVIALDLQSLAQSDATAEELEANFDELEFVFLQIDATKRTLGRHYRSQRSEIESVFNRIRAVFFTIEGALFPK